MPITVKLDDLPALYREVAQAYDAALEQGARFSDLQAAMRARAPARRRADPRGDPRAEETAGEGSRKSVSAHDR